MYLALAMGTLFTKFLGNLKALALLNALLVSCVLQFLGFKTLVVVRGVNPIPQFQGLHERAYIVFSSAEELPEHPIVIGEQQLLLFQCSVSVCLF